MRGECIGRLMAIGISEHDAVQLRRISMTLQRWFELECGNSDNYKSYCLVRGKRQSARVQTEQGLNVRRDSFEYDDAGKPYIETHYHDRDTPVYERVAERENGAKRRLARIMSSYADLELSAYVQTDPRGCALYILRPGDVPAGSQVDSCYNRGIAVYK